MQIKTNFQQKIEGNKGAVFRLKKLSVHALPGLCTLNILEYEISLFLLSNENENGLRTLGCAGFA